MPAKHQIDVCVRVRPLGAGVGGGGGGSAVRVTENAVVAGEVPFRYPRVVVTGSNQEVAFDAIAGRLVDRLHEGFSVTLLAYGQTGSGKTFTIFGPTGSLSEASLAASGGAVPEAWGIFPRTMAHLLRTPGLGQMHASAVEVYSNHAYDLLAERKPLQVSKSHSKTAPKAGAVKQIARNSGGTGYPGRDKWAAEQKRKAEFKAKVEAMKAGGSKQCGVGGNMSRRVSRRAASYAVAASPADGSEGAASFATVGETLVEIASGADVARLARQVEASRVAHGHALNARSSRSHCLVNVHLVTRDSGTGTLFKRQMLFVDLAGSERIAKSKVKGMRQNEAKGINQSLTCLGRVIKALGDGVGHIPFRDSMLTMLLKSSFGGRSCTSVVVNVASDAEHVDESVCSLRFGGRMTRVRNAATVVAGQNAAAAAEDAERSLRRARAELQELDARGLGPRFTDGSVTSEVKSFQRNLAQGEAIAAQLSRAKQDLIEANAVVGSVGGRGAQAALAERVKELEFQAENNKMIVLRQKSIKGFYREPSSSWAAKQAEIRALEAQVQLYSGK